MKQLNCLSFPRLLVAVERNQNLYWIYSKILSPGCRLECFCCLFCLFAFCCCSIVTLLKFMIIKIRDNCDHNEKPRFYTGVFINANIYLCLGTSGLAAATVVLTGRCALLFCAMLATFVLFRLMLIGKCAHC